MSKEIEAVRQWLKEVVIGLNLCPFAAWPEQHNQIRITLSTDTTEEALLETLQSELTLADETPASELETTLIVIPDMLQHFDDYNQFLHHVDALLRGFHWEGKFQVASFHPQYCFADTHPEDDENLTNRSPYPLLHIIREDSLEKAIANYPDPDGIPDRNIEQMNTLTMDEKLKLFPYLFAKADKD
ncbi:DUF1415 domain-containing protein [Endozoicomonas numazuensis]|uniref:Uncharacterized protein n=1 Tax=Endozoicomonas numazuensis TaxID=1137799 RepID=A0A081NI37_9GAMM|nr:DUF1415 domain-containing protein [Endozoicomonas numazuensis]KEQ18110.1 hypothetical protein GZ78_11115 [Endozoicomonas numazuensis]